MLLQVVHTEKHVSAAQLLEMSVTSLRSLLLHNATRVGRNPMLRVDSLHAYVLTCAFACKLTCLHAYTLTCVHAYMHVRTCLHAYML